MSARDAVNVRHRAGVSVALPRWLPLIAVCVVAVVLRKFLVANADVSWCITMAEKWLDGQRLYVDIIEVNPPATMLLYVVPVIVARLSGLPAEFAVDALVFLSAGLSLWLAGRILLDTKLLDRKHGWPLAALAAVALMIIPAQTFAEREHIALIAFLPALAVGALRAKGVAPNWPMAILAGLCAGLVVIIKPYFAAALLCTIGASAICARSWRVLFALENCIAAALLTAYAVLVLLAFPRFVTDALPLVLAGYVPVKEEFFRFIVHAALPLWAAMLLLIARLKRRAMFEPPFCLLLAASAGFSISYVMQQKGWPYHSYPMLALALIALGIALAERGPADRAARLVAGFVAVLMAAVTFFWMNIAVDRSALAGPIRAITLHPKMLALSADISVGHPVTRQAGGIWVGRASALWLSLGVGMRRLNETLDPQTEARLKAYAALDRSILTQDIAGNRPDVILVQRMEAIDWLAWARSDRVLAELLASYREDQTVGDVLILRRAEGP